MTYLSCPLCGRLCHLSNFHPESYDLDVELVEMQSLGRGRGFQVIDRFSALEDEELMRRISKRLKELLALIEDESEDHDEEKQQLLDANEELEDTVRSLEGQLKRSEERIEELERALDENEEVDDELLELVNDALRDVSGEGFESLEPAIKFLVDDYLDAVEEAEDLV